MSRIEELEKQITELDERKVALQQELELEKQKTEFEYTFQDREQYWLVDEKGEIVKNRWNYLPYDQPRYDQGHVFKTRQEAERERDKRALLTRFRQFRDKCNGDWKPGTHESKYYLVVNPQNNVIAINWYCSIVAFDLFGCFKKESDAERAIELFSDEIIRLWVDE